MLQEIGICRSRIFRFGKISYVVQNVTINIFMFPGFHLPFFNPVAHGLEGGVLLRGIFKIISQGIFPGNGLLHKIVNIAGKRFFILACKRIKPESAPYAGLCDKMMIERLDL